MIEQPTLKLFAITISARRIPPDGEPEVNIQSVVGLLSGDIDIVQASYAHAHQVFPDSEGWGEHQVIWTEIERTMMFGPYRLTWEVTDTTIGAEQ